MMNRILHLVVLMLIATSASAADIVVRQKIVPTKSVISLGDIADIHAATGGEARRLALTPLWPTPPDGEQRFVSVREIRDALVGRGFSADELQFYGASQVVVGWAPSAQADEKSPSLPATGFRTALSSSSSEVTNLPSTARPLLTHAQREALKDQVREEMVAYLGEAAGKPGSIGVEFQLQPRQTDLLAIQKTELQVTGGRAPWFGRQSLIVAFESEAGPQQLRVTADVWDTTPVLMARRAIVRGQLLTAADVIVQSPAHDTRVLAGRMPLYTLDEALGKEASRTVRPGEIVTADVCLAPQLVERNEIVTVVSAGGGIVVRRQAKALSDARKGEMAEVEFIGTKERLAARVVGPGRLAILGSRR